MPLPFFARHRRRSALFAVSLFVSLEATGQTKVDELEALKSTTDRWIELRSRHAQEVSKWQLDQRILQDSIATLEASKENLQKDLSLYQNEQEAHDAAIEQEEAKLARHEAMDTQLLDFLRRSEQRAQELSRRLPPPLLDGIQPLLAKIPSGANPRDITLPNRMQNLVALLTAIDEFNNKITHTRAIRELDAEETIELRLMYFGLAGGYAVDAAGSRAWTLSPAREEWIWQRADADAEAIHTLFSVYEKTIDPALVEVPFPLAAKGDAQ